MGNKLSRKKTKRETIQVDKGGNKTEVDRQEVEQVESTGCFSCFGFFKKGPSIEIEIHEEKSAKVKFSCFGN